MQDRFKFRVWKKLENKMVEGVTYLNPLLLDEDIAKDTAKNYVIMQCTGLKDKNGKLIFEGDIVKIGNGSVNGSVIESIREVKWIINTWNIPVWIVDKPNFSHYVEAIGNIYENKELLNEVGNR